jgi:hypothetical protein
MCFFLIVSQSLVAPHAWWEILHKYQHAKKIKESVFLPDTTVAFYSWFKGYLHEQWKSCRIFSNWCCFMSRDRIVRVNTPFSTKQQMHVSKWWMKTVFLSPKFEIYCHQMAASAPRRRANCSPDTYKQKVSGFCSGFYHGFYHGHLIYFTIIWYMLWQFGIFFRVLAYVLYQDGR